MSLLRSGRPTLQRFTLLLKIALAALLVAGFLIAGCAEPEPEANTSDTMADSSPLEGAWQTVEITTTGPDGMTNSNPEPGIRLFVDGHYSLIQVSAARPPQPDSTAPPEDFVAIWSPFIGSPRLVAPSQRSV